MTESVPKTKKVIELLLPHSFWGTLILDLPPPYTCFYSAKRQIHWYRPFFCPIAWPFRKHFKGRDWYWCRFFFSIVNNLAIGDRYDWTTGALSNGNEWRKFRAVPRRTSLVPLAFPCFVPLYGGTFARSYSSSTAKLRIWTLRIWGFRGPGFRSARQVLCGDASHLFLGHFPKHLSSVPGRTELCHEVRNPGPQKPQIIRNETTTWHCSNSVSNQISKKRCCQVSIANEFASDDEWSCE